jgi:hypothetical protein
MFFQLFSVSVAASSKKLAAAERGAITGCAVCPSSRWTFSVCLAAGMMSGASSWSLTGFPSPVLSITHLTECPAQNAAAVSR